MRLTFFVVWKSWASNKVRTLLTVLGVALGIAVVTAIHVLDHNTIQSRLQQRAENYGTVDLELLPKDSTRKPDQIRGQLAAMSDLIQAVGLLHGGESGAAAVLQKDGAPPVPIALYGLSPLPSQSFAHYHVAAGADLSDLDPTGSVLIGEGVAEALGLQVGDALALGPPPQAKAQRCVDGKLVSVDAVGAKGETVTITVKGILSYHALGRQNNGGVVVASFALARKVAPHVLSFYQVNRTPGQSADVLRERLQADFQVLDQRSAMLGEGSDERAFRNGIKMIGLLALVLGMLVVFQTLSQTLMERLKQIGLMRCLGTSRSAVAGIFLVDGLLLALLGAVLGVLLGVGLAWAMAEMRWTTLGMGKEISDFEVPPRPVLFAAGLGIFFTLAGSAFPLYKARNLAPARILQNRGLGDDSYVLRGVHVFLFLLLVIVLPVAYLAMTPLLADGSRETLYVLLQVGGVVLLFGLVLLASPRLVVSGGQVFLWPLRRRLPLATFMVQKGVTRNPGRFSAAVCGLGVVLVALVALKHITYALRAEVQQFSAQTMDRHAFLRGNPIPLDKAEAIAAVRGVRSVEFFGPDVHIDFLLRGLSVDDLARSGHALADDPARLATYRDERCLIVSQRWAELKWKQSGQFKEVLTSSGLRRYRILAVDDGLGFFPDERAWAVTSTEWLRKDFCQDPKVVTRIAIEHTDDADTEAVRNAVREVFPHQWYKSGRSITDYLIRDVTKDFLLFDVLLLLILGLVGVGLVNTMTIAAVGRAREIGVLRALGMENRSLRQIFLVEGVMVAALASVVAVAMGLPLGWIIVRGLNQVTGLQAPVVVPWLYVGLVPVLAGLTAVIAAILPGSRAIRMNPAEAVRYE